MGTILFSGVHGVGKGYFLKKVYSDNNNYEVLSASGLIKKYKDATDAGYKKVSNVKENQDILLTALREEQKRIQKNIVLDGHLCIINAEDEVNAIPEYFFDRGNVGGIILLQDNVQDIVDRLKNRDGKHVEERLIEIIQKKEVEFAQYLNVTYGIYYEIINHQCNSKHFEEIIKKIGGSVNG